MIGSDGVTVIDLVMIETKGRATSAGVVTKTVEKSVVVSVAVEVSGCFVIMIDSVTIAVLRGGA